MEQYYTIPEACELLHIGRTTAYKLMRSGKLAYVKIGSCVRISEEALKQVLTPGYSRRSNETRHLITRL